MRESSSLEYDIKTNYENEKIYSLPIIYPAETLLLLSYLAQEKVWDCDYVALYSVVKPKERVQIARDVDSPPCGLKLSQKRG